MAEELTVDASNGKAITSDQLDRLAETCQGASILPWKWKSGTNLLVSASGETVLGFDATKLASHPELADQRFIREASEWMASLVSTVKRLTKRVAELEAKKNG